MALRSVPFADKLYVALRTELQLYGLSKSCTDIEGTVGVKLLNNHVIGCELSDGTNCMQPQWDFIDSNTTVYVGQGVPDFGCHSPRRALRLRRDQRDVLVAKILSTDANSSIDCPAVLAALP